MSADLANTPRTRRTLIAQRYLEVEVANCVGGVRAHARVSPTVGSDDDEASVAAGI
jgi:hypothetical protein